MNVEDKLDPSGESMMFVGLVAGRLMPVGVNQLINNSEDERRQNNTLK